MTTPPTNFCDTAVVENLERTIVKLKIIQVVLDEPLYLWSILLSFFSVFRETYPVRIEARSVLEREIGFNLEKSHVETY